MNNAVHPLDTIEIDRNDPFHMPDAKKDNIRKLVQASHRSFMDVDGVLPWSEGIDLKRQPKSPTTSWIYGTPYWDALNDAERLELLWKETARDVSMFIWLEQTIPPMYVGYVNAYRDGVAPEIYEYLMIFSKEEIVHTLMFRRYMKLAGLSLFAPPSGPYASLLSRLPQLHPAIGILWTLTIEWAAELVVMFGTQGDDIEPLTRKMFHEHHVEEIRHITFGRRVIENFFNTASHADQAIVREQFKPVLTNLISLMSFNPEIASHLSFAFPARLDDPDTVRAIQTSPNNILLNAERFKDQRDWFLELGLTE
ncbi:diiron oxygenase [Paraburkholderia agricolaris]|uniref:Diiron oxygenase n=1 Tax=Paraburkholderia agricolaris TaxID=2152888 RepID=A0ABW8ZMC8_9BURK